MDPVLFFNNLVVKMKVRSQNAGVRFGKMGAAYFQSPGHAKLRFGLLGYNYESRVCLIHSGKCGKPNGSTVPKKECSTASLNKSGKSSLVSLNKDFKKLWELSSYKNKYTCLIDIVGDHKTLISAYEIIKSKPGNMTSAMDNETLDGIGKSWFSNTAIKLKNGSFMFKTARRVTISKPDKPGKRPLTMGNPRDKIVLQAIRMVLEQIFESEFLPTSHGFRKSRGCHSALEQIKKTWTGISWFLEFDMRKCFDKIDKHRLVGILCEKIDDQRFIDLIYKLINAGIIGWKVSKSDLFSRIPQDSIISPILCNIYLHKLDFEIANIQKEFDTNHRNRRNNKNYFNLTKPLRTKKFIPLSIEKRVTIQNGKRNGACKIGLTLTDKNDFYFNRIRYIRYIDDFLFGIAGPKELVNHIKKRVMHFVKSNLNLELTEGKITHIASGKVSFLGVEIHGVTHSKFPRGFGKATKQKRNANNKLIQQQKVKDDRILKAIQLALKKGFRVTGIQKSKFPPDFKMKVQAIKESILSNEDFSRASINTYKDFINAIYKTHKLVPATILETLKQLKIKLKDWENQAPKTESKHPGGSSILKGKFQPLPLQINAPLENLRDKLKAKGILSKSNKPRAVGRLMTKPDEIIVSWFRGVGQSFLNYYRCCDNFYKVRVYVDYFIRWSAIHTLSGKHRMSCSRVIVKWSKDLIIKDSDGFKLASFPNSHSIRGLGRKFLANSDGNIGKHS
jgi:retron-type reverse transcriptase